MPSVNKLFFMARSISSRLDGIIPAGLKKSVKDQMIKNRIQKYVQKEKVPFQKGIYPKGINLIGAVRAEMGLGQSCRLVADMIKESRFDFSIYNYDFAGVVKEGDTTFDEYISEDMPYEINLFHVNPCELGKLFMSMPAVFDGKYNIAFWLWELEDFPEEWEIYCQLFDEIWTPSEFAGRSIKKVAKVPVRTLPYHVTAPYKAEMGRKEFLLPEDQFLFLIMYDLNSTEGRKNPQGAIEAYKKAFGRENKDVGMIIKVNNAQEKQMKELKGQLTDYRNIYYITDTIDKESVNSLIRCADVFVSLHRAEGFGLVMAEAMLLETPVIATNWSSNTEFMDRESACMVECKMVRNPKTEGLYRKGCIWAEPDYDQAAEYMVRLWQDGGYYKQKQRDGKAYVSQKLEKERLVDTLEKYISNI